MLTYWIRPESASTLKTKPITSRRTIKTGYIEVMDKDLYQALVDELQLAKEEIVHLKATVHVLTEPPGLTTSGTNITIG